MKKRRKQKEIVEVPLPQELFKQLQSLAEKHGTTPDELTEKAVKEFLQHAYSRRSPSSPPCGR